LGHTLTGAIFQLKVARKMVKVDEDKAIEAIDKTQKITRDGFAEVKRAIEVQLGFKSKTMVTVVTPYLKAMV